MLLIAIDLQSSAVLIANIGLPSAVLSAGGMAASAATQANGTIQPQVQTESLPLKVRWRCAAYVIWKVTSQTAY